MIISIGKWLERAKFVVLFLVFTFMLYHILRIVTGWIEPIHKYKEPEGKAVKVVQQQLPDVDHSTLGERFRLFLWLGE